MGKVQVQNDYNPDYVSHPGESLYEILESFNMTQSELANRMGRPRKTINEIINGHTAITPETALELERVLRIPARFWNNRESIYREFLARQQAQKELADETRWLKKFPLKEMIERQWIEKKDSPYDQLTELYKLFGVANRKRWYEIWKKPLVAYRETKTFKSQLEPLSAWLRMGEIKAHNTRCPNFNRRKFRTNLLTIRELSNEPDPEVFVPQLKELCADAGVVLLLIPELPKARASGATFWTSSSKAVILLSLRYKTNDHLWFTFFHEAGHILLHKNKFIVEGIEGQEELENQADRFATDFLIDEKQYQTFLTANRRPTKKTITEFAEKQHMAPGIVVGRLQHDKIIDYSWFRELKISYRWRQ